MLIQVPAISGGVDPDMREHWINPEQITFTEVSSTNSGLYMIHMVGTEERKPVLTVTAKMHSKLLKLTNNK